MSRFVRASKVRNIYADTAKPELTFRGYKFKQPGATDAQGCKVNDVYLALSVGSGSSSIAIDKIDEPKRVNPNPPVLFHKSSVVDMDFNPFHSNLIASGDDSGSLYVWGIPDGGLTENVSDPLVEFEGVHDKAINNVLFHPTASHVLATGSTDGNGKLFDVEHEKEVWTLEHPDPLLHLAFADDGLTMTTTCKDKKLRYVDVRSGEVTGEKIAHPGSKTVKAIFLDNFGAGKGNLATVGFTVQSKRQLKLWDRRKLSSEIAKQDIDNTNSVFMPFYDPSLNLLYFQGRGETKVYIYEIVDEEPWQFQVFSEPVSKQAVRGCCMLPKRAVNVLRDGGHQNKGPEVARMYQVTTNSVTPVSWVIPRKNTKFWPELFTDAPAGKAACTAEQFFEGKKTPKQVMVTMDPKGKDGAKKETKGLASFGGGGGGNVASLKAEVERLKKLLDKHNIKY